MKPIFRNSMFGFHKEDVYNFISKQSRQYEEKIKELTEEQTRAVAELEKEKMLSLSNAEKARILSDVEAKISVLTLSVKEVLRCGDICDLQNKEIKSAFANMEERLEKAEIFREKAQKFDRLSGVLSSIFSNNKVEEDNASLTFDNVSPTENADFPQNDGIERLCEAITSLEKLCEELNDLISDSKKDE